MTQPYRRPSVSLWDGGTTAWDSLSSESATMLMKDLEDGSSDLVAMVAEADLVLLFIAAPEMLAACKYLLQVTDMHLSSLFPDDVRKAIALVRSAIHDAEVSA